MLKLWINNLDVTEVGAKVLRLPPLTVPAKRMEHIRVPGRSGTLTVWRGDYDTMTRRVVLHYRGDDQRAVLDLIDDAHTVRFGNEPLRTYTCSVSSEVQAVRVIADWYEIAVDFICQP